MIKKNKYNNIIINRMSQINDNIITDTIVCNIPDDVPVATETVKRKVGRPRTNIIDDTIPKRKVGRPRGSKHPMSKRGREAIAEAQRKRWSKRIKDKKDYY